MSGTTVDGPSRPATVPSAEHVAARWSANADRYDRWGDVAHGNAAYRGAWVDALAELVGHPSRDGSPVLRVADVGTGPGEMALLLAEMGHDVSGFDIAPGVLEKAVANAKASGLAVRFAPGDAYEIPLADRSVDVVVSRMVFWTLFDPQRALEEWQRVLAPNGRIVVIDGLHFATPTTLAQRATQMRGHVFWSSLARLDRARQRIRREPVAYPPVKNPYDVAKPPGMRWQSAADARAHFVDAGLDTVQQGWLDRVFEVDRRTASLRWRIIGLLPRFFTLTWERADADSVRA